MVLGFVAFVSIAAVYHTAAGSVELTAVEEQTALEVGEAKLFDTFLAAHASLAAERLFGDYWLLSAAADGAALREELLASGAAARLLPVYRPAASGDARSDAGLLITDGRIRARFEARLDDAEVQRRVKLAGGTAARLLRPANNLYEVSAASAAQTVRVAAQLYERHLAVWALPDFIYRHTRRYVPNDALFDEQWHHEMIGSTGAWEITRGRGPRPSPSSIPGSTWSTRISPTRSSGPATLSMRTTTPPPTPTTGTAPVPRAWQPPRPTTSSGWPACARAA